MFNLQSIAGGIIAAVGTEIAAVVTAAIAGPLSAAAFEPANHSSEKFFYAGYGRPTLNLQPYEDDPLKALVFGVVGAAVTAIPFATAVGVSAYHGADTLGKLGVSLGAIAWFVVGGTAFPTGIAIVGNSAMGVGAAFQFGFGGTAMATGVLMAGVAGYALGYLACKNYAPHSGGLHFARPAMNPAIWYVEDLSSNPNTTPATHAEATGATQALQSKRERHHKRRESHQHHESHRSQRRLTQ